MLQFASILDVNKNVCLEKINYKQGKALKAESVKASN